MKTGQEVCNFFEMYIAKDCDGDVFLYAEKPYIPKGWDEWDGKGSININDLSFYLEPFSGDWRQSLCTPQQKCNNCVDGLVLCEDGKWEICESCCGSGYQKE